jgi:hypothetical protein
MQGISIEPEKSVVPDGKPRAFIIDSIRHPAELSLLRSIYRDAFVLVGLRTRSIYQIFLSTILKRAFWRAISQTQNGK